MISLFADIYGNRPNPVFRGNVGYGVFFVVLIVVFAAVLAFLNRNVGNKADSETDEKKSKKDKEQPPDQ